MKLIEFNLVAVQVLDKSFLLESEIRSLFLNNKGEELILKTGLCDSEVNQCALSLDLRWVMGALELGVH